MPTSPPSQASAPNAPVERKLWFSRRFQFDLEPWATYDDPHHFQVAKVAKEIGIPLEDVLEYEKRNKARKSVIDDLERAIGDPAEVVPA